MAKEAKKSFLDFFKMKELDDDEFEDDLFDDDDDDEEDYDDYVASKKPKQKTSFGRGNSTLQPQQQTTSSYQRPTSYSSSPVQSQTTSYRASTGQTTSYQTTRTQSRTVSNMSNNNNKLVEFNNNKQQRTESYRGKSEVYVIKPQEISESQTVTDFLKDGKTIVINMEGLELAPAQRIIDFIGGACYALNGSLQAISANIFIAAPSTIEVSGDLREEILNESTVSPQLGRY